MATMRKYLMAIACILMVSLTFASCSKDTDPTESDLFVGTYTGPCTYTKGVDKIITANDAKVRVTKVGGTYNFFFDNGIPDITGVKFEKKDDNTYVSVGSGLTGITISAKKLNMLVIKDGATWTADCSR